MEVTEKAYKLSITLIALIAQDNESLAEKKLLKFQGQKNAKFVLIRLLVSYSQVNSDIKVAAFAIRIFERFKSKAPKDTALYYDIANGYQTLYELSVNDDPAEAYKQESIVKSAIKYFEKAGPQPRVLTNLGNLYDYIGRPVDAIRLYDQALAIDDRFGMALGNKAVTLENLANVTQYRNIYLISAFQHYQKALSEEKSVLEIGGEVSLTIFQEHADRIRAGFESVNEAKLLEQDLTHPDETEKNESEFVKKYNDFSYENNLYLNLHLSDKKVRASIGDELVPIIRTKTGLAEQQYVDDIIFRFNEISESFISARLALFQSQEKNSDFSHISEQTALINSLDYSVSNIYVGYLKMAFKEAYNVLDKISILLNHYLELEHDEASVYFSNVWFDKSGEIHKNILSERYLVGLYLLSRDLHGSEQSHLRNALTHRYLRVYRGVKGPKGTYEFEEFSELTIELLFKVKCAVTYLSTFITRKERLKNRDEEGITVKMPLFRNQNLDIW